MFAFAGSPVPVRNDLKDAHRAIWAHFAQPGPILDAGQRHSMLNAARNNTSLDGDPLGHLATTLYTDPVAVSREVVRSAITTSGEPAVVEAVALVSMLAAVDSTHSALGAELEPLPDPVTGDPTGIVARGMKKRGTHVPMPRHSITVALELLPTENKAYAVACGPHYMTFAEMASPLFERSPASIERNSKPSPRGLRSSMNASIERCTTL